MNIANKTFRNNKTGETIKVIDSFENIAILENKQKVDVRNILDPNQYTEQIDPSSFFNNQSAYNSLAEKIKNIPTNNILDDSLVNSFGGQVQPSLNESAIIQTTEEDEMAELARKYGASLEPSQEAIVKQQQAFSKYLGEEETPELPVTRVEVNQKPMVEESRTYNQPPVQRVEIQDPITTMFKNVKRNIDFKVNFQFNDKVPRLDFIEMMEDSYEISIIDFLAEEFTNKILNDPSKIRETIKNEIKTLVYGKKSILSTIGDSSKEEDENTIQKKEVNKSIKPTAKERIEIIKKLNSISGIEFQLKGEKSKAVIEAGNKRIEELKNKK
jgi:hypothetical protein